MKKTLLFSALLMLVFLHGTAQSLTLRVNANPSPYLSDWEDHQRTVQLIINYNGPNLEAKIKAQVFRNGTLVAASDLAAMPAMTIEPGVTVLGPEDLIPYNYVTYYGNTREQAIRTGRLPAGDYQLCLSLVEPFTLGAITEPNCQPFFIPDYQPPACLFPLNQTELSTTTLAGTTLRWTPVMPLPTDHNIQYDVEIYEVMAGQYPEQAIRSNRPIVALTVENQTFMPWPTDYELPEEGKYVWTIKAMDLRAEPASFDVLDAQITVASNTSNRVSAKMPCRFNDQVFLFDCETCQLLNGECGGSMVPDSEYEEEPEEGLAVSWGEIPAEVQQGQSIQALVKTSADPLVMDFVVRSLATNETLRVPNTADDFYWNTQAAAPGMYELQARVANGDNASDISFAYVNVSPMGNTGTISLSFDFSDLSDKALQDSLRRVRDRINRLPGQIRRDNQEANNTSRAINQKEEEQIRDWRRWDQLAASSYRNRMTYNKLLEIDKRFDQVPVAISPKVDSLIKLLDSLKNLGVAPQPNMAALRLAVTAAKANLEACQTARNDALQALNNLKTTKSDKHTALMQAAHTATQIMQNHGWAAGIHPYADGVVGFGGVGDENNTLRQGHPDYNTYNNAFNTGRQLNREIKRLNRQIAAAQAAYDAMDDCSDEEEAFNKAQAALANGSMSQAAQNKLDDLCQQIKDLMKPLQRFCEQNAAACSDLLRQKLEKLLGDDCPDPQAWRNFMTQFNQMKREKERIENQALVNGQNEERQRIQLESTIDRRKREINSLREKEKEARIRALERSNQLGRDNQAIGPLEAENRNRGNSNKSNQIKPSSTYANPLSLGDDRLMADAYRALADLTDRSAYVDEGSDCNCKMLTLRAAKLANKTPENLIGRLGVGVIFAPILALPISRGATLGVSLLRDFANSIFGGTNFTEDAFKSLLGFAGGEVFERLFSSDFVGDRAADLTVEGANQLMQEMAEDLVKLSWEGEETIFCRTPRRYNKKVKVTVHGLFNKRTGWTVLIIKSENPNCPDYMVKYRLDENGVMISGSIKAKAILS